MRATVVVVAAERVELGLELCKRPRGRLLCQVALERLVQALHLAERLRVVWARVLKDDPQGLQLVLEQDLATAVAAHEHGAVVREQRFWQAVQLTGLVEALNDVWRFDVKVGVAAQVQARVVVDQIEDLTTEPSAKDQAVTSACQHSLGSSLSKRISELCGRFCRRGATRPSRRRKNRSGNLGGPIR